MAYVSQFQELSFNALQRGNNLEIMTKFPGQASITYQSKSKTFRFQGLCNDLFNLLFVASTTH